ncbi:MAG TPA: hydroxymethylbilane synthase [Myxococcales bacterium]|nr:hydroxymethylbilane synthase [Myxococcales bacterium]
MLRIATRGSDLALAQARRIQQRLSEAGKAAELLVIKTRGDVALDLQLSENLHKGLFTSEVEAAVGEGRADLAVHSLKDMPTAVEASCSEPIVIERVAPEDVLLVAPGAVIDGNVLPVRIAGRVGTSAARRTAMLTAWRPDLEVVPIRGNVPTRVQKLLDGDVDAIILARAGLHRLQLNLHPLRVFILKPEIWLPAPGQGAIAVQTRLEDRELQEVLGRLSNPVQAQAVALERQALAFSEGGCHVPFGALAERAEEGDWQLRVGQSVAGAWRTNVALGAIDGLAKRAFQGLAEGQSLEPHSLWRLLDDPL